MTPTPAVKPLSQLKRRITFLFSLFIFITAVPLLVFYAIGYRFDFTDEINNIKSVGGMYVTSKVQDTKIYINDEPVEDMRIFQNAAYIQNLDAGIFKINTQGLGLQTWVKKLPVFPYFVTEVQSFNMPKVPQLRLITEYRTLGNDTVLLDKKISNKFSFASTTNNFFVATSSATSTFELNPEYVYVKTLFASSSEEKKLLRKQKNFFENNRFNFGNVATTSSTTISATTTKIWRNMKLSELKDEVYVKWVGEEKDIPYYFCVSYKNATDTISYYGQHVYDELRDEYGTSSDTFADALYVTDRLCRKKIRIDRLWQSVQWFDFFPGSTDYILMQLQDGLYVVETDDRSWQNTQLLYPGDYLEVVIDGGQIYIKDDNYYLEVFTEIQQ